MYVHSSKHTSDVCKAEEEEGEEGGKEGVGKKVVLVETMEALRKLKRGLALFPAPGEVKWGEQA